MKKLTEEQLNKIANEVFFEICPDYTDKDEHEFKTFLLNTILEATSKFIQKYQEETNE